MNFCNSFIVVRPLYNSHDITAYDPTLNQGKFIGLEQASNTKPYFKEPWFRQKFSDLHFHLFFIPLESLNNIVHI